MEKIEKGQRWQWECDESMDQYDVVDVITDGLSYTLAIVNEDYPPFTYSQADFDAEEDHWSLVSDASQDLEQETQEPLPRETIEI